MRKNSEKTKDIEKHIEFYYQESVNYTARLSSICRQLAFAEGVLLWFLKCNFHISTLIMILGFLFLTFYFIFDVIHYLVGYVKYDNLAIKITNKLNEKNNMEKKEYETPINFNYSLHILLYVKLVLIGIASLLLIIGFCQSILFIYKIALFCKLS